MERYSHRQRSTVRWHPDQPKLTPTLAAIGAQPGSDRFMERISKRVHARPSRQATSTAEAPFPQMLHHQGRQTIGLRSTESLERVKHDAEGSLARVETGHEMLNPAGGHCVMTPQLAGEQASGELHVLATPGGQRKRLHAGQQLDERVQQRRLFEERCQILSMPAPQRILHGLTNRPPLQPTLYTVQTERMRLSQPHHVAGSFALSAHDLLGDGIRG